MINTPRATESDADLEAGGVLRPFVETEREPLPPVEPPSSIETDDLTPEVLDDAWREGDESVESAESVISDLDTLPPRPRDEILAEARWTPPADDEVAEAEDGEEPLDRVEVDEGVVVPPAPPGAEPVGTVTLPRKAFLIGLGVVALLVGALVVLWQTAGDDSTTTTADPAPEATSTNDAPEPESADPDPAPSDAVAVDAAAAADEVDDLSAEVEALQGQLADQPPPSLPGVAFERIVVAADTKFVSAIPESVAVVSPFGDVSLIDPSNNRLIGAGNIATSATRVLRTPSAAWISNFQGNEILRVDPASFSVVSRIEFPGPDGIQADNGTLVVASYDGEFVARVDPGSGAILEQVEVGGNPTAVVLDADGGIWAAIFDTGELVKIDPATFEITERVLVGAGPVGLALTESGIWSANHETDTVTLVDPATAEILADVVVGAGPTELVGAWGSLWVTVTDTGDLVQIDDTEWEVQSRTPLGGTGINGGPTGITSSGEDLWIAMLGERSVVRVRQSEIG